MVKAQEMEPDVHQIQALCELAQNMDKDRRTEILNLALVIARKLDYSHYLAVALAALAHHELSEQQLADALEIAEWTFEHEDHPGTMDGYVYALSALGPLLSTDQRAKVVGRFVAELPAAQFGVVRDDDLDDFR